MTVSLENFMQDFTAEEREAVAARTQSLIAQELALRDVRQSSGSPKVPGLRSARLSGQAQSEP